MKTFETLIDDISKDEHFDYLTSEQQAYLMLELKIAIETKRKAFREYYKKHQINEFINFPIFYELDIHGTDDCLSIIDTIGFTKNDMYDD